MALITAPNIEVTRVVTGFMYELSIAAEEGAGPITRIDIGPYYFPGVAPKIEYPEAVTNEMTTPTWSPIRWYTDADGTSWLRYQGGELVAEDGEALFQFTSNFAPSDNAGAHLVVWRGTRSETFDVPVPDYTQAPPKRNSRSDSQGLGRVYSTGCLPQVVLSCLAIAGLVYHVAVSR